MLRIVLHLSLYKGAKMLLALEDMSFSYDVNQECELCCLVSREPTLPVKRFMYGSLSLLVFVSVNSLG